MQIKVSEAAEQFGFQWVAGKEGADNEICGVYLGDLLSWVMGNAGESEIWITIQGHVNIIAVAALTGVSGIIVAEGAEIAPETIRKADAEDIPVLATNLSMYEAAKCFMTLS